MKTDLWPRKGRDAKNAPRIDGRLWKETMLRFSRFLHRAQGFLVYLWNWICHFAHAVTELQPTVAVLAVSLALVLVLCGFVCLPNTMVLLDSKKVTLQTDGESIELNTSADTVAELLANMDWILKEGDVVSPALQEPLSDGDRIRLRSAKEVDVCVDGETRSLRMLTGSVAQALELADVRLDEDDIVSPSLSSQIEDRMQIDVSRVQIRIETEEQGISYQDVYVEESSMYKGETEVSRQGSEGIRELQIRVVLQDGVETQRSVVGERILEPAVNRIIYKGTREKPTPTPKPSPKPSNSSAKPTTSTTKKPASTDNASSGGKASSVSQGPKGSYSDSEIQMAAKLAYLEAKGTGSDGYKAVVNVLINRCNSSKFGGSIEKEIFRSNQFTVANDRDRFLSTTPDSKSVAAAEAVLLNGERLLPSDVLFFRTARAGRDWGKRTYYATIGANSFFK